MKHSFFLGQREQGSTILMALIAMGILGIWATTATQAGSNYMAEAHKIKAAHQIQDLERAVKAKTNCVQTIRLVTQYGVSQSTLVDQSGRQIDSQSNSAGYIRFGGWRINISGWNSNSRQLSIRAENENLSANTISIFTDDPMVCT